MDLQLASNYLTHRNDSPNRVNSPKLKKSIAIETQSHVFIFVRGGSRFSHGVLRRGGISSGLVEMKDDGWENLNGRKREMEFGNGDGFGNGGREEQFGGRNFQLNSTCLGLVNAMVLVGAITEAGSAYGQSTNAPVTNGQGTNAPAQLPDVVVSGERDAHKPEMLENPRYTEPLRDIPQSISVIPQALIREQNATTLRDVLRNVSGITMQAGEGGGGLPGDNLSIRGFNARNDIFLDGVRDYGSFSRDTYNTEQVEVYKGPTSATAGRGSAGGAVNIISKRPGLRPFVQSATLASGRTITCDSPGCESTTQGRGTGKFGRPFEWIVSRCRYAGP